MPPFVRLMLPLLCLIAHELVDTHHAQNFDVKIEYFKSLFQMLIYTGKTFSIAFVYSRVTETSWSQQNNARRK